MDDGNSGCRQLEQQSVFLNRHKRSVMEAINALGLHVTPVMIAAKTGLPVADARWLLNGVAAETGAVLQVTGAGTVQYLFKSDFASRYALRGMQLKAQQTLLFAGRTGFMVLRVSFGVVLLVSLLVAVLLIILALASLADGGLDFGSGGGGCGLGGGSSSASSNSLLDSATPDHPQPGKKSPASPPKATKREFFDMSSVSDAFRWDYTSAHHQHMDRFKNGNFFLECFSFLFGDGNPNDHIEDDKWRAIAQVIRANQGVVIAEQLAPYTGIGVQDDAGVLAVMQRFNGEPLVTESGNIVYVFEEFRNLDNKLAEVESIRTSKQETYLKENRWCFSGYSAKAMFNVTLLATLNFAASWWLFKHISTILVLKPFTLLIDFMLVYGVLFLLIPLVRLGVNAVMNIGIDLRNRIRQQFSQCLANPAPELRTKLSDKWDVGTRLALADSDVSVEREIVYSSDQDLLEQQFDAANVA